MSPPEGLAGIEDVLRGTKGDLLARSDRVDHLVQPGGCLLPERFPLRIPGPADPVNPNGGEPVIEMFMVGPDGVIEATGPDPAIGAWWRPEVVALVERVGTALAGIGVGLAGPVHVTASATPAGWVATDPHLDDDQPRPDEGVGVVAIAATGGGPRLATEPVACRPIRPPAPLVLDPETMDGFGRPGGAPVQQGPGERVVIFPRFGQLHAGPAVQGAAAPGEVRNLLVLRAGTVPLR